MALITSGCSSSQPERHAILFVRAENARGELVEVDAAGAVDLPLQTAGTSTAVVAGSGCGWQRLWLAAVVAGSSCSWQQLRLVTVKDRGVDSGEFRPWLLLSRPLLSLCGHDKTTVWSQWSRQRAGNAQTREPATRRHSRRAHNSRCSGPFDAQVTRCTAFRGDKGHLFGG